MYVYLDPPLVEGLAAAVGLPEHHPERAFGVRDGARRNAQKSGSTADNPNPLSAPHQRQLLRSSKPIKHRILCLLPPGPPVGFVPGGMHIMLMKPKAAYKEGDTIDLSLTLDDGTTVAVKATVRARNDAPGMNHDHMNHGAMGHDHKGS